MNRELMMKSPPIQSGVFAALRHRTPRRCRADEHSSNYGRVLGLSDRFSHISK
jgi:hypothetical protein